MNRVIFELRNVFKLRVLLCLVFSDVYKIEYKKLGQEKFMFKKLGHPILRPQKN